MGLNDKKTTRRGLTGKSGSKQAEANHKFGQVYVHQQLTDTIYISQDDTKKYKLGHYVTKIFFHTCLNYITPKHILGYFISILLFNMVIKLYVCLIYDVFRKVNYISSL